MEYIGQRIVLPEYPKIVAYNCSEIEENDVQESLWKALGFMLRFIIISLKSFLWRIVKKESKENVIFFKFNEKIDISCEIINSEEMGKIDRGLLIELTISENSNSELLETVEKFVGLFKKLKYWKKTLHFIFLIRIFQWEFEKAMEKFMVYGDRK